MPSHAGVPPLLLRRSIRPQHLESDVPPLNVKLRPHSGMANSSLSVQHTQKSFSNEGAGRLSCSCASSQTPRQLPDRAVLLVAFDRRCHGGPAAEILEVGWSEHPTPSVASYGSSLF